MPRQLAHLRYQDYYERYVVHVLGAPLRSHALPAGHLDQCLVVPSVGLVEVLGQICDAPVNDHGAHVDSTLHLSQEEQVVLDHVRVVTEASPLMYDFSVVVVPEGDWGDGGREPVLAALRVVGAPAAVHVPVGHEAVDWCGQCGSAEFSSSRILMSLR